MRIVNITELKPGYISANNIYLKDGTLLIAKGKALTESNITALFKIGLDKLYIEDDISEGINPRPPITDESMKQTTSAIYSMDIDKIVEASKRIVDELSNSLYSADMLIIRHHDAYTGLHSVNVAIYTAVLAKCLGFKESELHKIVQASLLHDIGKVFISTNIINKPGKLTDKEYEIMKKHSELGYLELKKRESIWSVVRVGVLEHHENENGTGYPYGKAGNEIHKIGKMIHIADVYDALTTARSYKDPWKPDRAMKYIRDNEGIQFDKTYAKWFRHCIPIYPRGTEVTLSDGRKALVESNNIIHPDKPVVRVLGEEIQTINLVEHEELSIVS